MQFAPDAIPPFWQRTAYRTPTRLFARPCAATATGGLVGVASRRSLVGVQMAAVRKSGRHPLCFLGGGLVAPPTLRNSLSAPMLNAIALEQIPEH
jgi:hypothetical protein